MWVENDIEKGEESMKPNEYNLTFEELDEIGHCVLADSIRDGDYYNVDDTIRKWLTQYKEYKPYLRGKKMNLIIYDDLPKKKLKPNCSKCHLWEDSDMSYDEKFMYCTMRKCQEKPKECKHDNNVRITIDQARSIHLQTTGTPYYVIITDQDKYWYLCLSCLKVFSNYT